MRPILLSLIVLLGITAGPLQAQEQASPRERVEKALHTKLKSLDRKENSLEEWLKLFQTITNETFVLDPSLPNSVGQTRLKVQVKPDSTVLDAFSVCLALSGLRYTILDGAVFVSTEGKLADKVLNASALQEARRPVTEVDAAARNQSFDPYQDNFVQPSEFISYYPWRHWEPPRVNPNTGLTDFPGPPIDIESPQVGHPRFRYTSTPYFLKPEYLAYEQEKREYREEQDRHERAERQANARALAGILQLLKDNPDMKAEDILKKLGGE